MRCGAVPSPTQLSASRGEFSSEIYAVDPLSLPKENAGCGSVAANLGARIRPFGGKGKRFGPFPPAFIVCRSTSPCLQLLAPPTPPPRSPPGVLLLPSREALNSAATSHRCGDKCIVQPSGRRLVLYKLQLSGLGELVRTRRSQQPEATAAPCPAHRLSHPGRGPGSELGRTNQRARAEARWRAPASPRSPQPRRLPGACRRRRPPRSLNAPSRIAVSAARKRQRPQISLPH